MTRRGSGKQVKYVDNCEEHCAYAGGSAELSPILRSVTENPRSRSWSAVCSQCSREVVSSHWARWSASLRCSRITLRNWIMLISHYEHLVGVEGMSGGTMRRRSMERLRGCLLF